MDASNLPKMATDKIVLPPETQKNASAHYQVLCNKYARRPVFRGREGLFWAFLC